MTTFRDLRPTIMTCVHGVSNMIASFTEPNAKELSDSRKANLNNHELAKCDDLFVQHAIVTIANEVWDLLYRLSLNQMTTPQQPPVDHTHFDLYIDGSCTDPSVQLVRISSSAVTLVQGQYQCCVVKSQIVPGLEQSSSRGEILAGILGLAFAYNVTFHTDYQLFHDKVCDFKRGCQVQSHWTNIDLCEIVCKMVAERCNHVEIKKLRHMKIGKPLLVIVACRHGITIRLTWLPKIRSPVPPFFQNTKKLSRSCKSRQACKKATQVS